MYPCGTSEICYFAQLIILFFMTEPWVKECKMVL